MPPFLRSPRRRLVSVAGALVLAVTLMVGVTGHRSTPSTAVDPASAAASAGLTGTPASPDGERPNIVLISTDDMAVSDLAWMPVTRRLLAEAGVSFQRALSPHPLCCPARAAILTGQYAQNNGVKSNQAPYNFAALDIEHTLPVWLSEAGYLTGFTGKYLNGFGVHGERQPGWTYWDPSMIGQYAYTPFQMYNDGDRTWYRDINNVDYINAKTVELVEEWAPRDQPFFIWASHVAPHGRLDEANGISSTAMAFPPERYARDFATVQSPSLSDLGYLADDVSDNNSLVQSKKRPAPDTINQIFRSRIRTLQAVDDGVADLIDTLERTGELDDTYVMFTSDNGYLLGEHHLVTKNVPYRQSVRVPLLVRGPGVPQGVVRDQRALMIDLAPTIADLAGATPNLTVDGVSLVDAIEDDAPLRETVLIQAGPSKQTDDGGTGWWWRGVTTPRYTYARFNGDELEELYDHQIDPAENTNLADDPRYADVLAELRRRTEALVDCAGPAECSADFGPDPRPDGS